VWLCEVEQCNILYSLGTQCATLGGIGGSSLMVWTGVVLLYTRIRQQRLCHFFCAFGFGFGCVLPSTLSDIMIETVEERVCEDIKDPIHVDLFISLYEKFSWR
jgi:hypothetical protein